MPLTVTAPGGGYKIHLYIASWIKRAGGGGGGSTVYFGDGYR